MLSNFAAGLIMMNEGVWSMIVSKGRFRVRHAISFLDCFVEDGPVTGLNQELLKLTNSNHLLAS
jgi:hypothetical protein